MVWRVVCTARIWNGQAADNAVQSAPVVFPLAIDYRIGFFPDVGFTRFSYTTDTGASRGASRFRRVFSNTVIHYDCGDIKKCEDGLVVEDLW